MQLAVLLMLWILPAYCDNFCPMSSVMDLNKSHSFFYPVDIYAPKEVLKSVTLKNEIFPCYGALLKNERHLHNCSSAVRFCPLKPQNMVDATQRRFGSFSLCHLRKKLNNNTEKVRVIALGGSVTVGSGTQWCNSFDGNEHLFVHERCSWFYHFGEWLKRTSAANVTHHNLAHSGHTSYVSAMALSKSMDLHGIYEFTANDVIFLDHSANDDQQKRATLTSRELESLIRRVYSLSANNSWPSIVLLDGNPMATHGEGFNVYPAVYENMSRHYDIPMWSYRDAVLSDYTTTHQGQFASFLNFSYNDFSQYRHDIHPPWHVHLFMADLYAAIFRTELNNCSDDRSVQAEKRHQSQLVLPKPVSVDKLMMECMRDVPDLLSMSFDEVKQGVALGSFNVTNGGWHLGEDGRGRGGFMIEHKKPITSDNQSPAILSFSLVNTTKELISNFHDVFVQVLYLRTYMNAGEADVLLCGVRATTGLDALWSDYQTHRISIPEWVQYRLVFPDCVANNYSHPTVEFVHKINRNDVGIRGNYKFKVVSVKVCAETG